MKIKWDVDKQKNNVLQNEFNEIKKQNIEYQMQIVNIKNSQKIMIKRIGDIIKDNMNNIIKQYLDTINKEIENKLKELDGKIQEHLKKINNLNI